MGEVVRRLADHSRVNAVVLADVYEREYRGEGLEALMELARFLDGHRHWSLKHLTSSDCKRCEDERRGRVEHAIDTLPGDPLQAHAELKLMLEELRARAKQGAKKCVECRNAFSEGFLEPMVSSLGRTKLVGTLKNGQNRDGYAKLLSPLIRPCFLTSRVSIEPPSEAELVDAYKLEGGEVRIYRLSNELQHLYFLIPLEYRLSPEHVVLLHRARRALLDERQEGPQLDPLEARRQLKHLGVRLMTRLALEDGLDISREDVEGLACHFAKFTAGLGIFETLLSDAKVQDMYVDAPVGKTPVHIYHRDFEESLTNIYLTPDDAESLISRFRAISGRPFSEADPVLDLDLGGVRVAAIGRPLSPEGFAFALRRHKPTPWTLPQLVRRRFLTPKAAGLLGLLVDGQISLLVTGSRGAGKTSLLGALMLEILPKFRIIALEDTAELPIAQFRSLGFKVQALRTQAAVATSGAELSAQEALRAALRLGESVLVIGEVRGLEAKTLYEAMRVGAAGNSVMGTIHGSSAYDVFERVVQDLGISPSSFKATDAIVVASLIRHRGGVSRSRRVTQITEVRKGWRADPASEGGFEDLMSYDPASDELEPTPALVKPRSRIIGDIARKWGTGQKEVLENLDLRAKIHAELVRVADELGRLELLEAEFVVRSNITLHCLFERQLRRGGVACDEIFKGWCGWLRQAVKTKLHSRAVSEGI